ncbi:MAG TPA: hypothetical protein VFB73_15780 [Chloroflexota bacterium]|nr:hypothetical protein [Chloroflexota bacterium]
MQCEGCGTQMVAERAATDEALTKWKCPRCGSWCLTQEDDVVMAAWLLEGREWPR